MSTKFLTWSKGQSYSSKVDRKYASSGTVPIPIEYISIKGVDYGRSDKRSSKMKRKPIPLEFEKPEHSNTNSFALHDAAIRSATTLMAVMNDVLKSPHLNAHFLSQQSGEAQPVRGRPRSHTAPPTPLSEAPGIEPVELEGSLPVWPKPFYGARSSMDITASSRHGSTGRSMERSHSSPQNSSYTFHNGNRQPTLVATRNAIDVRAVVAQAQHARHSSTSASERDTTCGPSSLAPESTESCATSDIGHGPYYEESKFPDACATALDGRESTEIRPSVQPISKTWQGQSLLRSDSNALLHQISTVRRSHEAHVSSLKESHDREVDSHRAYIAFLESCSVNLSAERRPSKQGLTLDTSHINGKAYGSLDVSASTSLQSLESTLDVQRRTSIESANAEAEALKRKLSLCRKTQSEIGDIRRERDHFRDTNEKSERRIAQLKDIVRKSKDAEKAMMNKVQSLEAALLAANVQRIDVLEGYHEACEQIRGLHDRNLVMIKKLGEVVRHSKPANSPDHVTPAHGAAETIGDASADLETLARQVEDLQQLLSERDACIRELELERRTNVSKVEMCRIKKQLADTEAVRVQYNTLLHAELRRQSKMATLNIHAGTPQVEEEASATIAEKLKSKPGSENPEKRCEFLEKELRHCVSEIILYKLDVRGYRRDLKAANANIKTLQSNRPNRPGTPDSMETHPLKEKSATPQRRPRATSGLGISLYQSRTPTRSPANCLSTPQQQRRTIASLPSNNNTPLELDKKLPNPPSASRDPSPNLALAPPVANLNRAETLRSLSESIISSYANRATPEQENGHMPPLSRGRSAEATRKSGLRTDPYAAIDAIAVPIARYTPDMLKTPFMPMAAKGNVKV